MNECTQQPKSVPSLMRVLHSEKELDTTDTPQGCKSTLKDPQKTQCQSFTSWTQYTASMCGALGLAASLVHKELKDKALANKIVLAIEVGYDGISGVNKQFLTAIDDVNANKTYHPVPEPDPIPPFPSPTSGSDVEHAIESAWAALKPWLEKCIGKLSPGSVWIKVLEGIISSSEKMISDLKKLFGQKKKEATAMA